MPTLTALEFPRIQTELAGHASCQLGKELAAATEPLATLTLVLQAQQESTEARSILAMGRSVPFGGIQDIRRHVERAAIGGVLRPDQLGAVADTLYGCRQLHRFLTEHAPTAPLLGRHAIAFGRFDEVEEATQRCIERGAVSSRASKQLRQVRLEVAALESKIQDRLQGLLRQHRSHLQEALITTRSGHYVIPVKASNRNAVPGAVHGASASGSTLFVEPEAIKALCEELASWRAMEEAEVERILISISGLVAAHADGLTATLQAVAELDLIFARARLAQAWEARPVRWNQDGLIDLQGARHPLLGARAIGNRIRITTDERMLIVTGPNTGGKTLLLKTLGLLVVIARCGMHIPVAEGSTLCFMDEVFADIGDHQSLEQSLSTFSGHMAAVAPMLAQAGPQTLILLDELGSGTDPHEGTALGIALLEAFREKGCYVMVTTHLREIKEFGRQTAGCIIAGMGFDGSTLMPTYQLIYGTLGESRGIEVAARAGLPATVVSRARALVYGGAVAPAPAPAVAPAPAAAPAPAPAPAAVAPAAPVAPAAAPAPAQPLVVAAVSPSRCRVRADGAEREYAVRDGLRRRFPGGLVPGDRVRVRDGQLVEVANRQTVLIQRDADTGAEAVVAANPTRMLILVSARQPDFHATMLARHLFYAERQGVRPIICLSKADLAPAGQARELLEPFRAIGYDTVAVSGLRGTGLPDLERLIQGQITAVIGYPGAGKSTLLAALTPTPAPKPPAAIPLADDAWLIDMPGLRELGVWKPDLSGGFREFAAYAGRCSHTGCLHRQEKGCAVRLAAETGLIDHRRFEQYQQLLQLMRLA